MRSQEGDGAHLLFASGKLVLSLLPSLLPFFAFLYFLLPSVISPTSMANITLQ